MASPDTYQLPDPTALRHDEDAKFSQRATFYFTEEQLLGLEVVMLKLRTEQKLKVGKSELMQSMLDFMIEDYALNKGNSWIARHASALAERV